ncbi:MAG: type II toxin-antitoxin system VapC family toxin [Candidatus Caldarchaeum sp.]
MSQVFIDVNIPMYAGGSAHLLREPSQQVILAIVAARLDAVTDVEIFQEILYRYLHINQREKGFRIFDHFHQIMAGRILPIEDADTRCARALAEQYPTLDARDLIHLAVMLRHQIQEIITTDRGFDSVPGIRRIDPTMFQAIK